MDLKDKFLIGTSLGGFLLGLLTFFQKFKPLENWMNKSIERWLEGRPKRELARRLTDEEMNLLLSGGHEEVETICLLILREYDADRVTVMEFEVPKEGPTLGTVIVEERTPRMHSVKASLQGAPLLPEIWAEVLRIHALDYHCRYIQTARLVECRTLRAALIRTGVSSAYYQTLPAAPGHAGGLLSISWKDEHVLTPEHQDALHLSARALAAVLRFIWAWKPTAAS